jgi:hypothetical protein
MSRKLPPELWLQIYQWDPTYYTTFSRLWTHDIILHRVEYIRSTPTYIWYSDGVHRKWIHSVFAPSSKKENEESPSSFYDESELTKRFWVLQSDGIPRGLDDDNDKALKNIFADHSKNSEYSKWTSLHFFDTLEERNEFIHHFGPPLQKINIHYQNLIDFYYTRFCS